MRKITIDGASSKVLKGLLPAEGGETVLIKREGRPLALLTNVQHKDEEQIETENDPEFWRMIAEARKRPTVPFAEVKARLLGRNGKKVAKRSNGKKGK